MQPHEKHKGSRKSKLQSGHLPKHMSHPGGKGVSKASKATGIPALRGWVPGGAAPPGPRVVGGIFPAGPECAHCRRASARRRWSSTSPGLLVHSLCLEPLLPVLPDIAGVGVTRCPQSPALPTAGIPPTQGAGLHSHPDGSWPGMNLGMSVWEEGPSRRDSGCGQGMERSPDPPTPISRPRLWGAGQDRRLH